ncbi:Nif3-like dinuclear metal center hexameric protein [Hymenobacter busanensis]|uniref:GTP cyclohydrolase 1 type 2 homolog n=1 Tax=Hymenobacter busanensis TaxID=2607656 RepID=A0A7L4ZVL9_9BACT|nr:Nif3-like dinuclear metal center hexameric protein [Hymenobacter busanensis]KAA9325908.1 Nif3-like dinuclear metal center hexameric protein [Hymenobacter busanensis]QHJ06252.1 Nif3-like dinuclear metal center hexameric protein [Hymenobacter busanensis]
MSATVHDLARALEGWAPLPYQESYDNAGLQCGDPQALVRGVLIALDCTPAIIDEAMRRGCNVVVVHHPVIFQPLKRLTGATEVERTIMRALRLDVAVYAAHTNLDNVRHGVSCHLAEKLGLENLRVLDPKPGLLGKLITYVPSAHTEAVLQALYAAGAGRIGDYHDCSFRVDGTGTFTPGPTANPHTGTPNQPETVQEQRVEVLLPLHLQQPALRALREAHPYEEVAYELIKLENQHQEVGSGMIGELAEPLPAKEFLRRLRERLHVPVVKHTEFHAVIRKVAVCGGAGSFLTRKAVAAGADAYVTGDIKYHEFFAPEGRLLLCDVGHYESEQYTGELFRALLTEKFSRTFAVLLAETLTNPVRYDF